GVHLEGEAVKGHPFADAHTDGGDLVLAAQPLVGATDPDADPAFAATGSDSMGGEGLDDPLLEALHETADVAAALGQVEHAIGNALAGAMIGELPAAPRRIARKTGIEQVFGAGRGTGGIERRVFQEPD